MEKLKSYKKYNYKGVYIMDKKLFRKTYPFICVECGEFTHTKREYCEKCGAKDTINKASKDRYDNI